MMIKKSVAVAFLGMFFFASFLSAGESDELGFKPVIKKGDQELVLNGAGVRNKFFIDVYGCGLYLKEKSNDPVKIINADEPMVLQIVVLSGLMTTEKMVDAYKEGFENATGDNTEPIKDKIAAFVDGHKGEMNKKDIVEISYDPSVGTQVLKNGNVTATVPGLDFKKAVFGIWLCDKPAQADLKKRLLGK